MFQFVACISSKLFPLTAQQSFTLPTTLHAFFYLSLSKQRVVLIQDSLTSCQIFNSCFEVVSGGWKHYFRRLTEWQGNKPSTRNDPKRDYFQLNIRLDLQLGKLHKPVPSSISFSVSLAQGCAFHSVQSTFTSQSGNPAKLLPTVFSETWVVPGCREAVPVSWTQQNYFQILPRCCSAFRSRFAPLAAMCICDGQMSWERKPRSTICEDQGPLDLHSVSLVSFHHIPAQPSQLPHCPETASSLVNPESHTWQLKSYSHWKYKAEHFLLFT